MVRVRRRWNCCIGSCAVLGFDGLLEYWASTGGLFAGVWACRFSYMLLFVVCTHVSIELYIVSLDEIFMGELIACKADTSYTDF